MLAMKPNCPSGRKAQALALSLIATMTLLQLGSPLPAGAAVDTAAITAALEEGNVFASGIRVSVRLNGDEATISTYRNSQANDDDCRIEAVLAAKTVIDLAPDDIYRVLVYFYEPDLSSYKQVQVSRGDVKSFASGETSKEELLKSLRIKSGSMSDAGENVASYLNASRRMASAQKKIRTRIKGQDIEILCQMDGFVSDDDCKLEAVRIAQQALKAARGYRRVRIIFTDPRGGVKDRYVELPEDLLNQLAGNLEGLLASVPLSNDASRWLPSDRVDYRKLDIKRLRLLPGPLEDERNDTLARLRELASAGVGMEPFLDALFAIEDRVAEGKIDQAQELLTTLNKNIDGQEESSRIARDYKPSKDEKSGDASSKPGSKEKAMTEVGDDGTMDNPEIRKKILANPKLAYNYWRTRYTRKDHGPEDFPNYLKLLKVFVSTLIQANRASEASPYQSEVEAIRKKHPEWKI